MQGRWSDTEAGRFLELFGGAWGEDLALRTYTSRLLGAEPSLVLHGGGNTSVKGEIADRFGDRRPVLRVKASGRNLAGIEPGDHVAVDLAAARRLAELPGRLGGLGGVGGEGLDDLELADELRNHRLDHRAPTPSIETPVHAVIPAPFVDHTHADAVLALTNRPDGESVVRKALGPDVLVLPYVVPGLELAAAVADALAAAKAEGRDLAEVPGMVWVRHGLVTWGASARQSYERTIELVSRAEEYLQGEIARAGAAARRGGVVEVAGAADPELARERLERVAPVLRGLLARSTGEPDRPYRRVILRALQEPAVLGLLARADAREIAVSPPLTADHLIRTGPWPLWIDELPWDDTEALRAHLETALESYLRAYRAYAGRHLPQGATHFSEPLGRGRPSPPAREGEGSRERGAIQQGATRFSAELELPRVILVPGLGVVTAGSSAAEADVARDIAVRTLEVKTRMADAGARYLGLSDDHMVAMEYRPLQLAKLAGAVAEQAAAPLARTVALVTGAAGAIGTGICHELLAAGAHLVATDLAGERLERLAGELAEGAPGRVLAAPMDVTDPASVTAAFDAASREWGGIDLLVINAGAAHVAGLAEMALADFERLERINVHGTLLPLSEAARRFRLQATGGDVVLVSTKNVFSPGASFGAYSATKAAAHQLARVASQELAALGVRVNMVAPDAVFSEGEVRSGLWAEVGPARMKARGLTESELEAYYRDRNLLRARITARHVARAVLFFATRQTPTTGATLPVDGGLPDATPR